jgi:hypothetical protein
LLCRGVPRVVWAAHDFHAGMAGRGPLVPAGTRFRLQAPEIFAAGYEQDGGELVLMAAAAAGHLFTGDLVPVDKAGHGVPSQNTKGFLAALVPLMA